jgi:hypothetical protein
MKPGRSQDTSWTWLQMAQRPKHEAVKLQGPEQKMLKLAQQGALSKPWRRRRQGPTCRREQVSNWPKSIGERDGAEPGRNGPGPVGLACFGPGSRPLWPTCSSIYCLYLCRPPHRSIHQRVADTKVKHREEAVGRRKSSSCLGDGLGHALAAMVGSAWWSHGGVPEPMPWFHQGNCTLHIRWWYKSCLFLTLSYFDACLFICVVSICH